MNRQPAAAGRVGMASLLDLKARLKEVNELVELGVDGLEVDRALLKEQIKELWLSENQDRKSVV